MSVTKYKLLFLFAYLSLTAFSCEEDVISYVNIQLEADESTYQDGYYLLKLDYYADTYLKVKQGEKSLKKVYGTFNNISNVDRSCYGKQGVDIGNGTVLFNFSGRPYLDLLELKFPDAKSFNNVAIDLNDRTCYPAAPINYNTEPINLEKSPHIFPVKPDTLNHLYVTIDGIVVFDENILITTKKKIIEIK
jgi:hypothetical protein